MNTFTNFNNVPATTNNAVSRLHTDIDRLFDGFFRTPIFSDFFKGSEHGIMPKMDLKRGEKAYTMAMELPGIEPEAVKIELTGNVLTLSGEKKEEQLADKERLYVNERRYGSFTRSFTLPEDADADNLKAVAKNGVLTLEIPRRIEPENQTKTISIEKA